MGRRRTGAGWNDDDEDEEFARSELEVLGEPKNEDGAMENEDLLIIFFFVWRLLSFFVRSFSQIF